MAVKKKSAAKPPVKAKAKRKAEIQELTDPKVAAKREREIKKSIARLDEKVDARYEFAMSVYNEQDDATQKAIDHMVEIMKRMAGRPVFRFEGQAINSDDGWAAKVQQKNFTYFAVRMLAACAEWDIRIANYTAPKKKCARCGERVRKNG